MKEILSYLLDPNKTGVYVESFSIDISNLRKFLKAIVAADKEASRTVSNFKLLEYDENSFHLSRTDCQESLSRTLKRH